MVVVDIKDLHKSFGSVRAVEHVNLRVHKGETLSIVGESGCGKTTLAKMIVGLTRPDGGAITLHSAVQMVFQDPYSSLDPLYSVRQILQEALHMQRVSKFVVLDEMKSALSAVGLDEDVLKRYPHEFSGGQRQRIAIARALLTKPEILVLDEPTSALDVLVQKQIIDLLAELKSRLGLTYIFISHNLRVVKTFSDRIAVMRQGRILETGKTADVYANPKDPYTKALLSAAIHYTTD